MSGECPRRDVMGTAESGQEVVKRVLVGDVDGRQLETPLIAIAVEKIVVTDRNIEEIPGGDSRRIVVVVLRARCRYL